MNVLYWLLDLVSWMALLAGIFFLVVGGIGVLRMPDFYTRIHAGGLIDTLGVWLILGGLMIQGGLTLVTVKLLLILIFLWFTSPSATHILTKAAFSDPENPKPLMQREDSSSKT